jgi:hypothetical protein
MAVREGERNLEGKTRLLGHCAMLFVIRKQETINVSVRHDEQLLGSTASAQNRLIPHLIPRPSGMEERI